MILYRDQGCKPKLDIITFSYSECNGVLWLEYMYLALQYKGSTISIYSTRTKTPDEN